MLFFSRSSYSILFFFRLHQRELSELLPVAGNGPLALLDHGLDGLLDLRSSSVDLADGELLERSGVLDVGESRLERGLLGGNLLDGGLGGVDLRVREGG